MVFPLSRDDVDRHLKDLGYRNVSDDQLDEFIKDLKRLIRFEEKQTRLKGLIQIRKGEISRRRKFEVAVTSPRSSCSSSSGHFSDDHDEEAQHEHGQKHYDQKKKELGQPGQTRHQSQRVEHRRTRRSISYCSESNSISVHDEFSVASSSTTSSSSVPKEHRKHKAEEKQSKHKDGEKNRKVKAPKEKDRKSKTTEDNIRVRIDFQGDDKSRDKTDGCDLNKSFKSKSFITYEQVLPKQPEFPAKPTCSFIRAAPSRVLPKSDPVKLYQSYKEHWDRTKFPGDDSTKQLRWTVREWMMGHRE